MQPVSGVMEILGGGHKWEGEGQSEGRTSGNLHCWTPISVSDPTVQHGGPNLCDSKIASTKARRPIARLAPLQQGKGMKSSFHGASCNYLATAGCNVVAIWPFGSQYA